MTNNKQQTAVEWIEQEILNRDLSMNLSMKQILKQAKEMEKEQTEMYKECLEQFVPIEKWDNATKFLSTYGSGLAKDFSKNETYGGNK
jgi:hypothetical protein